LFVYTSNAQGAQGEYVGALPEVTDVPAGFQSFHWDGKVNGGKLAPGYYNFFAFATKARKTDYTGVNYQIK
jgi:minor extracellular serine protease Vpr